MNEKLTKSVKTFSFLSFQCKFRNVPAVLEPENMFPLRFSWAENIPSFLMCVVRILLLRIKALNANIERAGEK